MTHNVEINIMTTKPSLKVIGFGLVGAALFGVLSYQLLTSIWTIAEGTNYQTGTTIMWILFGLFISFSLVCLFMVLALKTITLTNQNLIIKRPLLFLRLIIPLENIDIIKEDNYKINSSYRGTEFNVYTGKQMIIELHKGKTIKINSFEISDYYTLIQKFRSTKRQTVKTKANIYNYSNKYEGYGWLIFALLLTIGLISSVIIQKL